MHEVLRETNKAFYRFTEAMRESSFTKGQLEHLLELGVVSPEKGWRGRRLVRRFTEEDIKQLREVKRLRDLGRKPREIAFILTGRVFEREIRLTERERLTLELRHPDFFDGSQSKPSFREIGKSLGVSRQRAYAIYRRAVEKLKKKENLLI